MRLAPIVVLCFFAASCVLLAQDSQDNQPHIQPRSNASPPQKTQNNDKQKPQAQPSPDQQPQNEAQPLENPNPQPSPANPDSAQTGESSSKDSEIDINAGPRSRLPLPPSDEEDDKTFAPFDPHRAMKDLEVGNYYLRQKNYRAAQERFNDALKYKPNDAEATYGLAFTQEKMDLLEPARRNYSKYLEIMAHGPRAKDCEEGLKRVEARLEEVSANDGSAQEAAENIAIGEKFLAQNNYDAASERFQAAVRLAPDNPTACFRLAQSLRGMQQLDSSRLYYQKYLELEPKGTFAADAKKAIADITYIIGK